MVRFVHHYLTFWSYKFLQSGLGVFFKVSILTITLNTCKYLRKKLLCCERSSWSSSGPTEKEAVPHQVIEQEPNAVRQNLGWMMHRLYWRIYNQHGFMTTTQNPKRRAVLKCLHETYLAVSRCFPMWLFKQVLHSVVVHHVYFSLTSQFVPKVVTVCKTMRSCRLNDERNRIILKTLHVW